jgi:hypothetical protein
MATVVGPGSRELPGDVLVQFPSPGLVFHLVFCVVIPLVADFCLHM